MLRKPSAHYVTILNLDKWQKNITEKMIAAGKIESNTKMEAGYLPLGLIEKDGKHYLIDHDGVGSFDPLEDYTDYIDWYEHTYVDGKMVSMNLAATARTNFDYNDLVNEKIITKKRVRLNKYVRTFGERLDRNYANIENFLDGRIDKHGNRIKPELKTQPI
jgi:hypothetical protein